MGPVGSAGQRLSMPPAWDARGYEWHEAFSAEAAAVTIEGMGGGRGDKHVLLF